MRTIRTPRKFARSAPTGQAEARMASPLGTASPMPRPSRNAGSFRGGMSGYRVPGVATTENAAQERALIQSRSADLTANDWAASSAVNAITTNAVGQGLQPQSDLDWERLGISEQEALELQDAIERVWEDWVPTADVRGMMHFGDLQYLGLRSMLRQGELLHVPVMACDPLRPLSLATPGRPPDAAHDALGQTLFPLHPGRDSSTMRQAPPRPTGSPPRPRLRWGASSPLPA